VPLTPPGCASTSDVRPFAAQYYRGSLYVGLTCTGESTTAGGTVDGSTAQLHAYVYAVNPTTLAFGGSPVLDIPLNYPRGCGDGKQLGPGSCFSANWRPWSPIYRNAAEVPPSQFVKRLYFPQPWLTAIDFDRGNMIVSLRDRLGDQSGLASADNPARDDLYYGVATATFFEPAEPASGWTTESNGRCGGLGAARRTTVKVRGMRSTTSAMTLRSSMRDRQRRTASGPGISDVIAGVIHPIPTIPNGLDDTIFDSGVRWFINNTGGFSKNYRAVMMICRMHSSSARQMAWETS
jgi:hypothetical protein